MSRPCLSGIHPAGFCDCAPVLPARPGGLKRAPRPEGEPLQPGDDLRAGDLVNFDEATGAPAPWHKTERPGTKVRLGDCCIRPAGLRPVEAPRESSASAMPESSPAEESREDVRSPERPPEAWQAWCSHCEDLIGGAGPVAPDLCSQCGHAVEKFPEWLRLERAEYLVLRSALSLDTRKRSAGTRAERPSVALRRVLDERDEAENDLRTARNDIREFRRVLGMPLDSSERLAGAVHRLVSEAMRRPREPSAPASLPIIARAHLGPAVVELRGADWVELVSRFAEERLRLRRDRQNTAIAFFAQIVDAITRPSVDDVRGGEG